MKIKLISYGKEGSSLNIKSTEELEELVGSKEWYFATEITVSNRKGSAVDFIDIYEWDKEQSLENIEIVYTSICKLRHVYGDTFSISKLMRLLYS